MSKEKALSALVTPCANVSELSAMYQIKPSRDFDAYFKSQFKLNPTPVHQIFSEKIVKTS
jgi:hypothetical protein